MTQTSITDLTKTDPLLITYKEAYKFLADRIGEKRLKKELTYYLSNKPTSLEAVFKRMLGSLKNRQGWQNYIASVEDMETVLEGFNPQKLRAKYGDNIDSLYIDLEAIFGAKYKFDINNKRNSWRLYAKGILSSAKFLSSFRNFNEFDDFVNTFSFNEYAIAALPMLLEKEIFGYGFPLACDFLKEIGYTNYGKPDVHLKDIMFGLGLVSEESDYEVFKAIVRTALLAETQPVMVDKVYWIIGSGKIENSGLDNIGRLKKEFVSMMKPKLENIR